MRHSFSPAPSALRCYPCTLPIIWSTFLARGTATRQELEIRVTVTPVLGATRISRICLPTRRGQGVLVCTALRSWPMRLGLLLQTVGSLAPPCLLSPALPSSATTVSARPPLQPRLPPGSMSELGGHRLSEAGVSLLIAAIYSYSSTHWIGLWSPQCHVSAGVRLAVQATHNPAVAWQQLAEESRDRTGVHSTHERVAESDDESEPRAKLVVITITITPTYNFQLYILATTYTDCVHCLRTTDHSHHEPEPSTTSGAGAKHPESRALEGTAAANYMLTIMLEAFFIRARALASGVSRVPCPVSRTCTAHRAQRVRSALALARSFCLADASSCIIFFATLS
jgi:hypothetical protein